MFLTGQTGHGEFEGIYMVSINVRGRRRRYIEAKGRAYVVGETHHRAKLTDADVDLIFALADAGLSQRQIAAKFDDIPGGISRSTVRDVLLGRTRGAGAEPELADSTRRRR